MVQTQVMEKSIYQYTSREESLNVITHLPGVFLGILFTILLVFKSGNVTLDIRLISLIIYGITFTALFIASSLYHKEDNIIKKRKLKTLDHSCIYLFMAGCYTPFVVNNMVVTWKYYFLAFVWLIAGSGVVYKCLNKYKNLYFSVGLYVLFAYMCLLAKKDLLDMLPNESFELLLAGGFFYTTGALIYMAKKIPYHHAVWHIFALLGATLHFFAIYKAV